MTAASTPYPLASFLPAVLQEDQFAIRWTAGLDDVLAPMINTIDCLHGYLDPRIAPPDFVRWLARWFGVLLDENIPLDRQRAVIADAVDLYRLRGTHNGLLRHLRIVVDGTVEIEESGGVSWSRRPRLKHPDDPTQWVRVTITTADPAHFAVEVAEAVIRAAKPVHVVHELVVRKP
jgi:phage tail-like protein